jgi:hypothetical protein
MSHGQRFLRSLDARSGGSRAAGEARKDQTIRAEPADGPCRQCAAQRTNRDRKIPREWAQ